MIKSIAKLLNCYIVKKHGNNRVGFTLVELLIVITVVGVLSAGVVTSINIVSKINSANLAKADTFAASVNNSLAIDLVGEWTFDDGTAKDTSGYGHNGVLSGPLGANNLPQLTTDRHGQNNKAYSFDGTDDYIQMPALSSDPQAGDYTVTWWVYPFNLAQTSWAGVTLGSSYQAGFMLTLTRFLTNDGADQQRAYVLDWQQWQFVTLTHTLATKTFTFRKNGATLAANLTYTGTLTPSDGVIKLGTYNNVGWGYYVKAYMDDVRIYKQVLSLSQIQKLYAQGLVKHQIAIRNIP